MVVLGGKAFSYERGTPSDLSSDVPDNGSKELLQVHHPRVVLVREGTLWVGQRPGQARLWMGVGAIAFAPTHTPPHVFLRFPALPRTLWNERISQFLGPYGTSV